MSWWRYSSRFGFERGSVRVVRIGGSFRCRRWEMFARRDGAPQLLAGGFARTLDLALRVRNVLNSLEPDRLEVTVKSKRFAQALSDLKDNREFCARCH